eukprot:5415644-Pleurochrysis_carterae.AAC.2
MDQLGAAVSYATQAPRHHLARARTHRHTRAGSQRRGAGRERGLGLQDSIHALKDAIHERAFFSQRRARRKSVDFWTPLLRTR